MAIADTYDTAVGAITMPTTPGGAGVKDKTQMKTAYSSTKSKCDRSGKVGGRRVATGNDLTAGNSQGGKDVSKSRTDVNATALTDQKKRQTTSPFRGSGAKRR